jgi:carboxyl-terminal processing protease
MNKQNYLAKYLGVLLLGVVLGYGGNSLAAKNVNGLASEQPQQDANINLSLFWRVWSELSQNYVFADDIDDQKLTYGAIKGVVEALDDPYSGFLNPEEAAEFRGSLDNELEGIGAELTIEDDLLTVVTPIKDSPAELAGLKARDVIAEIDGKPSLDLNILEAVKLIRGPKGTKVTLLVVREGRDPFELTIERNKIEIESVTTENYGNGIFMISINQFSNDTATEFNKAVRAALLANAKGVILDLRNNGGGYLDAAEDILAEFLTPGKVMVKTESKVAGFNSEAVANGRAQLANLPVAVLINGASASASEIVAGALQDHRRGHLIGEQSFGKGTVQEVVDYEDGSSLRLTIARWLTPSGRFIHEKGLTPDEIVELTEADYEQKKDPQLDRAKAYLKELSLR